MKILITGGTGFIGCYFVRKLLELGHPLSILDLHPFEEGTEGIDPTAVEFLQGDIRDPAALDQAMKGCQAVLHLAAAHHDFGISDQTFEAVNVQGSQLICDAMDRNGISNICFFSTVAIYGAAPPPIDEDAPTQAASPYGKTKLGGEHVFMKWVNDGEKNHCLVIRPTVTFGPGNFANMFALIKQIETGAFLSVGNGQNIKSLSYVENLVDATAKMWFDAKPTQPDYAAYNYVCKPDLSSQEIAEITYESLGKKPPRIRVPYWLARTLALPLDFVIAVTGKNFPVSGARIKKLALARTQYESEKIREDGFEQSISLPDGIDKMARWYLKKGKQQSLQGAKRRLPPAQPKLLN